MLLNTTSNELKAKVLEFDNNLEQLLALKIHNEHALTESLKQFKQSKHHFFDFIEKSILDNIYLQIERVLEIEENEYRYFLNKEFSEKLEFF